MGMAAAASGGGSFPAMSTPPSTPGAAGVGETVPARRAPLDGLRLALSFLTRIPMGRLPSGAGDLGRAAAWFPLVGAGVGALAGGIRMLAGLALPSGPATVLGLATALLVTGALHEDGLADCADALAAHAGRERRLEIMRDPRVGSYGALAVGAALLFSYACLAGFGGARFLRAAVVAHALSRLAPLVQARLTPPARVDGLGARLRVGDLELVLAGVTAAVAALLLAGPVAGATALGVSVALAAGSARVARRAVGGCTGDTLGAAAKLAELAVYGVLAGFWR